MKDQLAAGMIVLMVGAILLALLAIIGVVSWDKAF
jgi:hypothetical protein